MSGKRYPKFELLWVSIDKVKPNTFNPNYQPEWMQEHLRESIKELGFVDAIVVREVEGGYEILNGEHRWKAAKELGLTTIPIINIGEVSDSVARKICLALNLIHGAPDMYQLVKTLNEIMIAENLSYDDLTTFLPIDSKWLRGLWETYRENPDLMMDLMDTSSSLQERPKKPTKPVQEEDTSPADEEVHLTLPRTLWQRFVAATALMFNATSAVEALEKVVEFLEGQLQGRGNSP